MDCFSCIDSSGARFLLRRFVASVGDMLPDNNSPFANLLLLFFIASQPDQKCTLEDVCYNISSKIISRSTIQYILKEGVEIGFFEKITNEKDKREKYYKITQVGKKSLEDWAFSQKKVFSNLNTLNSK